MFKLRSSLFSSKVFPYAIDLPIVPIKYSNALVFLDSRRIDKVFSSRMDSTLSKIANKNIQQGRQAHIKAEKKDNIRRLWILFQLAQVRNSVLGRCFSFKT